MNEPQNELSSLIDRSVKILFRDRPEVVLRLAGVTVNAETIRVEDPNLNLPELRADHVFIIEGSGPNPPYAIYLEYQLKPDVSKLPLWCIKWGGLRRQLGMSVLLLVLYLERGDRATFPSEDRVEGGGLETKLSFNTIRLWEHRARIVDGELPELAPLLVLCEEEPTEQTVRQEVELIHDSGLPRDVQVELLSVAFLVALRAFARETLLTIFREDMSMIREMEIIKELVVESGALEQWATDTGISARLRAEGKAEGLEMGKAEGLEVGKTEAAREMTLRFLTRRFGDLPAEWVERIGRADVAWCQSLFDRALGAAALTELSLQ